MLIVLPETSNLPLYRQIADAIKEQLFAGALKPGDELPPVRILAESLGINLHTVRHSYQILEAEGLIIMGLGRRTRIRPRPASTVNKETENILLRRWKELERDAWLRGLDRDQFRQFVNAMFQRNEPQYDR
jgi:DNA-binding transcriptional regulator YhcF (GntR family)